ncbi:MAG: HEAT repeat domain-containing protein [Planctomycetes bacterium]|nr:HEAT repeat domain-containing protein [Planctomycetota bacterium]
MNRSIALIVIVVVAALAGCRGRGEYANPVRWIRGADSTKEQVANAFDPDDADLRREGIVALSRNDGGLQERYLRGYAILSKDPAAPVRSAAIVALGRSGSDKYLPELIDALVNDPDAQVRADAAEALGKEKVQGESAVEPLSRQARGDPDPAVRVRCVRALRQYKTAPVLGTLIRSLGDEDFAVRRAARSSLVEMTYLDGQYDAKLWRRLIAEKEDPFAPPPAKPSRHWWNWLGL